MYWNSNGQFNESVMIKLYSPGPNSEIFDSFEVNPFGPLHSKTYSAPISNGEPPSGLMFIKPSLAPKQQYPNRYNQIFRHLDLVCHLLVQ